MLESILDPELKAKAKRFLRRYASIPMAVIPLTLGCGGEGKGKIAEVLGSQPQQPTSTTHYQQTAKTDASGRANLSVRSYDISTRITDTANNNPLANIDVAIVDHGDIYRLLAVDPLEKYSSSSIFIPINRLSKPVVESVNEGLDLNQSMAQFFEHQPRFFEGKGPISSINSQGATKIATIPLSFMRSFFLNNDALMKNAGIYEFMLDKSGEFLKIPALQFASTLNKERTRFITNVSDVQDKILNILANAYGTSYEPVAHYWDVYETKTPLGPVLTFRESPDRLCTLWIDTYLIYGNAKIEIYPRIKVTNPSTGYQTEKQNLFTSLREGDYIASISEPGYNISSKPVSLRTSTSPFFKSTRIDLTTGIASTGITSIRRISISLSKSSYPAVWFDFESGISTGIQQEFNPPSPIFDLWIEPRDPELSSVKERLENIIYVGDISLSQVRQAPKSGYVHGYFEGTKDSNGKKVKWGVGSTFVAKTSEGFYAKMRITSLDKEKNLMNFEYRLTGNPQGIFPE